MGKHNKLIFIACIFVLILIIFLIPRPLNHQLFSFNNFRINSFLPFNLDKEKNQNVIIRHEPVIKMLFVGDIMLDRHVKEKMTDQGVADLLAGLKNDQFDFLKYDIINANLEGAVTDSGNHYPPEFSYDFAFAPAVVRGLKAYNFKIFNLANNHLMDQGERGLKETRTNLERLGFKYYGCQDGQAGDCSFTSYQVRGLKVGFVGFSQVYKTLDQAQTKKIIADLKKQTDLVIINLHWGTEYQHIFNKVQQQIAHELIDAGADMIIGHHPHVVQGLEIYKDRPIFYSLGNFIFDQYFSRDTQEELAVELDFKNSGQAKAILYPLISKQSQPSLMVGQDKEKYLEKITSWSKGNDELIKQIEAGEIAISF